jgi:hypothetical protein
MAKRPSLGEINDSPRLRVEVLVILGLACPPLEGSEEPRRSGFPIESGMTEMLILGY